MIRTAILLSLLAWPVSTLSAAQLDVTSTDLFVYLGGPSPEYFHGLSPEFASTLDSQGFGTYSWLITNNTSSTWTNFVTAFFLDVAWDIGLNLPSNEYADFLAFGLPLGAPLGALPFTGWEADEPGYVFGDIYTNAAVLGVLDNTNAVPSTAPDDVSLALSWTISSVAPGESFRITILHLSGATNGLAHYDPDSAATLFVNGYAEVFGATGVPEPATALLTLPLIIWLATRRRSN